MIILLLSAVLAFPPTWAEGILATRSGERVFSSGDVAVFTCSPSFDATDVQWIINGSYLENLNLSNVLTDFSQVDGSGGLRFSDLPSAYNDTTIQCIASSPSNSISSNTIRLLIEDNLPAVGSLRVNGLNISWTAPFSLRDDPITYCASVVDRSSNVLFSQCNLSNTVLTAPSPSLQDIACKMYEISVFPVNTQGNGTATSISKTLLGTALPEVEHILRLDSEAGHCSKQFNYTFILSVPVCNGSITLIDCETGGNRQLRDAEFIVIGIRITIQLTTNHRYDIVLNMGNSAGLAVFHATLNTHELDDVLIDTQYQQSTSSRGALFSFVFLTEDGGVDFNRSALLALDRNTSLSNYTLPFNLHPGHYRVYVYIFGCGRTFASGIQYPKASSEYYLNTGSAYNQELIPDSLSCHIDTTFQLIWAKCSYTGNSSVGFQMTAQSSNGSEVYKLYSSKSMTPHAPAAILVDGSGAYKVAIFSIKHGMGVVNPKAEHIQIVIVNSEQEFNMFITTTVLPADFFIKSISGSLGITFVIVVVLVSIITVLSCKIKSQNKQKEPQTQQLYEEITPPVPCPEGASDSAVHGTQQPLYEEVEADEAKLETSYQITLCSAYGGASLEHVKS